MAQAARKPDRVILATKVGMEMGPNKKGLSKAYIFSAVEDSLKRLQTDYIDLYQSHTDDADTPVEETLEAYAQLIQQGKVRAIGASNYGAERLLRALEISHQRGYPSYQCLQPLYNLYDRSDYETKLEPLCRERGLGVITYYSWPAGFSPASTGRKRMYPRAPGQRAGKCLNERGLRILEILDRVAGERGSTPATVSLAWLIARPGITAPIASATNLEQLHGLMAAPQLKLDPSEIEMLNRASAYST